jgi:hypothetical protein
MKIPTQRRHRLQMQELPVPPLVLDPALGGRVPVAAELFLALWLRSLPKAF